MRTLVLPPGTGPDGRLRVLFVCYGNACRSPMAESYAHFLGPDLLWPTSAGVQPLGWIPPEVEQVLAEDGVPLRTSAPRALHELGRIPVDLIVDLTRGLPGQPPGIPLWVAPVPDPFGGSLAAYRAARDAVRGIVRELLRALRQERPGPAESPGPRRV